MTHRTSKIFVTVDAIVFRKITRHTEILLIQRGNNPFKDHWALPGGFVDENEDLSKAVVRELEEETGLKDIKFEQLHTFGKPGRDPRGHMISVAYIGWCQNNSTVKGSDDAKDAQWFAIEQLPALAFDHEDIIALAKSKI